MRAIVLVCLAVVLFAAYAEARPSEESRQKLRESGAKMVKALREAMMKVYEKARDRVVAYFAKDDLGEKITDVVVIFLNRITARLEKYTDQ
ncbi:unnamed protein product [Echinostoma caproni]|uniref:Apolipoprotein C-I n=1 Tax=Echinostoma caproni TaxID=27848 RepID=A0A183ABK6_9TREM|nr:unnamed protein product [Echinostoma caproni]